MRPSHFAGVVLVTAASEVIRLEVFTAGSVAVQVTHVVSKARARP